MSTTGTTPSLTTSRARPRPGARVRTGQAILTAMLTLCAVVALSTIFVDDPFEPDAVVLIASFGVLASVLGTAAVWGAISSPVVQWAVWAIPLFFVSHVAALGTWVPDAPLATLAAIGAALVTGTGRGSRAGT